LRQRGGAHPPPPPRHVRAALYDRAVLLFDPVEGNEAAAAALELCTAIAAAVGLADADETPLPWGRAHLVARALASAARTGEVLVDDLLRRRLGPPVECEPVELPTSVFAPGVS
jgi:class 3 adenylate cyclase